MTHSRGSRRSVTSASVPSRPPPASPPVSTTQARCSTTGGIDEDEGAGMVPSGDHDGVSNLMINEGHARPLFHPALPSCHSSRHIKDDFAAALGITALERTNLGRRVATLNEQECRVCRFSLATLRVMCGVFADVIETFSVAYSRAPSRSGRGWGVVGGLPGGRNGRRCFPGMTRSGSC